MDSEKQRILAQRGRIKLIVTTGPTVGDGYAVSYGSLGIWRGESFIEAQRQFRQAARVKPSR